MSEDSQAGQGVSDEVEARHGVGVAVWQWQVGVW